MGVVVAEQNPILDDLVGAPAAGVHAGFPTL
jgi:hypothetical protein